jgi:uncharacterized membrane protein HdeD (DUF308 family)
MVEGVRGEEGTAAGSEKGTGTLAVILGAVMIILGILCMIVPKVTGLASVIYLGLLLALGGIVEAIAGARTREGQHRGVLMAGGLFSIAVGVLMASRPQAGLAALTILLAGFLIATGLYGALTALFGRYRGRGWDLMIGIVALLLGLVAIASWPISALWLIGTLVGIEILVRGAGVMALGLGMETSHHRPALRPTA